MKKLSIILIVVMLFNFSSISSYANEKSNLSLKLQLSLNNEVVQLNVFGNRKVQHLAIKSAITGTVCIT